MRKPQIALTLTTASLALAGLGPMATAAASPEPCPVIPRDRIDSAIASIEAPLPGATWQVGTQGGSADCSLSWVELSTAGGTASSPTQVLLFDHVKYSGTATQKPHAYTSVVDSAAPGQITVRFRWLNPGDANANPTGQADVRYQTAPQAPPHPIDPLPAQVAD